MTTVQPRSSVSRFAGDFVAFMAPFLAQILVFPAWAFALLPDTSSALSPQLLRTAWPLLLVPVLAIASAVYWRRKPDSGVRLTLFAGAASGAVSITVFLIAVLTQ